MSRLPALPSSDSWVQNPTPGSRSRALSGRRPLHPEVGLQMRQPRQEPVHMPGSPCGELSPSPAGPWPQGALHTRGVSWVSQGWALRGTQTHAAGTQKPSFHLHSAPRTGFRRKWSSSFASGASIPAPPPPCSQRQSRRTCSPPPPPLPRG